MNIQYLKYQPFKVMQLHHKKKPPWKLCLMNFNFDFSMANYIWHKKETFYVLGDDIEEILFEVLQLDQNVN
jgi:hypothetical protein